MRSYSMLFITIALLAVVPFTLSGCKPTEEASQSDDHGDHDHDHAEGPHGGHLLELKGGDAKYQAEWLHDDGKGEVTVYLLDVDGKTAVENPPEEITISLPSESSPKTYTLPLVEPAVYVITDPTLITALEIIVEGQEPTLNATIGEKPMSAKFEEHDHDHGHEHDH